MKRMTTGSVARKTMSALIFVATLVGAFGVLAASSRPPQRLQAPSPAATPTSENISVETAKPKSAEPVKHDASATHSIPNTSAEGAPVPARPHEGHGTSAAPLAKVIDVEKYCFDRLKVFPGKFDEKILKAACAKVHVLDACYSVKGDPIFHFDRPGTHKSNQKILVFSLIHGDETPAGSVGRFWMERLDGIDPRNTWRVVPLLNPDGETTKTRTNANKVDLNRNFPTKDWNAKARDYWVKQQKSNPRRFPGDQAASEPETLCALKHLQEFNPDFVVSIHTPLKVLDYDGPKVKPPKFDYLPWRSLGHYPGSLGRYMWFERETPVLTMELREDLPKTTGPFTQLQDIIGLLVSLEETKEKPKRVSDR